MTMQNVKTVESIRRLLADGAESVTRPISKYMEDVFVLHDGRLWVLTNCRKNGSWQQVGQTCLDQEYDEDGNELY